MELTIRKSEDNKWGFVESFSVYKYNNKGVITVTLGVTPEGRIAPAYVMRGNKFISVDEIDREMGVEKYIKAKKPFYTLLSDGYVAEVKAGYDLMSGEFVKDKSSYSIYQATNRSKVGISEGNLYLKQIHETSDMLESLMFKIARQVSLCRGDRRSYLLSRL